jgi:PST family polysaccharide transporter
MMAVLARLLCPDDFGTVAIATVFINFFSIFTNIGVSSAIVQNKELTSKDINHIYMFTIWIGIALSVIFFTSTRLIAGYYQDERLIPIATTIHKPLFFIRRNSPKLTFL